MSGIQRYKTAEERVTRFVADNHGSWVKFSDHEAAQKELIEALDALLTAVCAGNADKHFGAHVKEQARKALQNAGIQ